MTGEETTAEREARRLETQEKVIRSIGGLDSNPEIMTPVIMAEEAERSQRERDAKTFDLFDVPDFARDMDGFIADRIITYGRAVIEDPVLQQNVTGWFDSNIAIPVTEFFEQPIFQQNALPPVGESLQPQITNNITYNINGGNDPEGQLRIVENNTNRMWRAQADGP